MTDNEVARKDEVLAALTRILRREATESAIVTTRERVPTLCADGKVRYSERTDTRVVEIPPKISDVNRAADLLGRRCGLWDEAPETRGEAVCIVDDVPAGDAADRPRDDNPHHNRKKAARGKAGGSAAAQGRSRAGGLTGSRAVGLAGGPAEGRAGGLTGGPAEGRAGGLTGGPPEGRAVGLAGGPAEGRAGGLAGGPAEGRAGGLAGSRAVGLAGGGARAGRRALDIRPPEIHTKTIPEEGGRRTGRSGPGEPV